MAALLAFDRDGRAAIPQTCRLCQQDDEQLAKDYRLQWGCDDPLSVEEWHRNESADIASALAFSPCFRCDGDDPDCPVCEGTNQWKLLRCPYACIEPWHTDVCHGVVQQRHGLLPFTGGWMQQPALYVRASRIVQAELVRIESDEHERAVRKANRAGRS